MRILGVPLRQFEISRIIPEILFVGLEPGRDRLEIRFLLLDHRPMPQTPRHNDDDPRQDHDDPEHGEKFRPGKGPSLAYEMTADWIHIGGYYLDGELR